MPRHYLIVLVLIGRSPASCVREETQMTELRGVWLTNVDSRVLESRDRIAEAFTWASTALLTGVSGGTAAGGVLVERYSPAIAMLVAAVATLGAAAVAYPVVARDGRRDRVDA